MNGSLSGKYRLQFALIDGERLNCGVPVDLFKHLLWRLLAKPRFRNRIHKSFEALLHHIFPGCDCVIHVEEVTVLFL